MTHEYNNTSNILSDNKENTATQIYRMSADIRTSVDRTTDKSLSTKHKSRDREIREPENEDGSRRRESMLNDIKSMIKDYKNKANYSEMVDNVSAQGPSEHEN